MAQVRTLRLIRRMADVTQDDMAKRAGLERMRYYRIEHGIGRTPTADERAAVARALQVPVKAIRFAHDEASR